VLVQPISHNTIFLIIYVIFPIITVSYRAKTDAATAEKLFFLLNEEGHHRAYIDRYCLVPGEKWENGFLQGLLYSRVVLLLVSEAGIAPIRYANKKGDNMLLEVSYWLTYWTTAWVLNEATVGDLIADGLVGSWPRAPETRVVESRTTSLGPRG
jgi:TIR domain